MRFYARRVSVPELFHYTCDHGQQAIGTEGLVLPMVLHAPERAQRLPEEWAWLAELSWFTTMRFPDPVALGLTRATIDCDRTRWRYRVTDTSKVEPYLDVVRAREVPRSAWRLTVGDHRPGAWWVAREPVPVELVLGTARDVVR